MGIVLAVVWFSDAPRLLGNYRTRIMTLDRAFPDEEQARDYLSNLLGADVFGLTIRKVDLVNDTTDVEVRFRLATSAERTVAPLVGVMS